MAISVVATITTLSAWWLLLAAVPMLVSGEWLVRRVRLLSKLDLPAPIVGGILIALIILLPNLLADHSLIISTKVAEMVWSWLVMPEPEWLKNPPLPIFLPFSTAFFCCIGLNASWQVARTGSKPILLLLSVATLLGIFQNLLGIAMCNWLGQPPLLGVLCGSVTLTGGPSTALGFAHDFERAGLPAAGTIGTASAMFGIVCASLLAGTFGGQIVRVLKLRPIHQDRPLADSSVRTRGLCWFGHCRVLAGSGREFMVHLLILLACIKVGAWLSYGLKNIGLTFPVYMGAMLMGIMVRNLSDLLPRPMIRTPIIQSFGGFTLGLFLVMATASLNLMELTSLARPMLTILALQIPLTLVFALLVTFIVMGRNYDAAIMAAGHVGFGLGITPNAVATVDVLTQKFGPSAQGLLAVTTVGAFLIDLTNAFVIAVQMNLLKSA